MTELRTTDTNSANDSKGRAFGLEGNDFIYVLVAFVFSLGTYIVLTAILHVRIAGALILALPVLLGTIAWVVLLRHGKPAGYAEDWFDHLVNSEGWSFASRTQPAASGKPAHEQSRA